MTSTEQIILHYQKDIERICSRPERERKHEERVSNNSSNMTLSLEPLLLSKLFNIVLK